MVRTGLRQIVIEDLALDEENPRLEQKQGQAKILADWSRDGKSYRMAKHVAANGLSPLEIVAVIPHPDLPKRFIVVDGNRRLTALKLLHNPSLAQDDSRAQRFRQLAKEHKLQQRVTCMVFPSREEADPWIELRHSGEAQGVGTVAWNTLQKYRFKARRHKFDRNDDAVRFLDSVYEQGWISQQQRQAVPVTTLRRVLGDRKARSLLGVELTNDGPVVMRPPTEAKRLVRTLVDALAKKGVVRTIDRLDHRRDFVLDQLTEANVKPAITEDSEKSGRGGLEHRPPKQRKPLHKRTRGSLAPKHLGFTVGQPRCQDILGELQLLQVSKAPNAAVVLFRVFVELTTDHYLERNGARPSRETSLLTKIRRCLDKLAGTADALSSSKRQALEKVLNNQHHPLHPDTLNAFVHNPDLYPLPSDLPKIWDQIEAFVASVWKALEGP